MKSTCMWSIIGGYLAKKLKREGDCISGVDIKEHEFVSTKADEFLLLDLREDKNCTKAIDLRRDCFDGVYQLAADMGGMEFLSSAECEIMHNNTLINIHMIHTASQMNILRYFFSSPVCVYRDMGQGEPEMLEDQAYHAYLITNMGKKTISKRILLAYGRNKGMKVRIARFQNCYGSEGT